MLKVACDELKFDDIFHFFNAFYSIESFNSTLRKTSSYHKIFLTFESHFEISRGKRRRDDIKHMNALGSRAQMVNRQIRQCFHWWFVQVR